jgi:DEAD/DEAH box helicase domain-containing protein
LTHPSTGPTTLDTLGTDPELVGRIQYRREIPARMGRTAPLATPLHPEVAERLRARRIAGLWTHQARAVDILRAGGHAVVATGTASDKSLCYQ